ncbi:hypothetical protein DRQ18_04975 [bacterium]|nr:MAG: hypothetical protein DRQ18_04975 [bacterium]
MSGCSVNLSRRHKILLFVLLGIILRIILAIPSFKNPEKSLLCGSDSIQYESLAKNLVERRLFTTLKPPGYKPEGARTPFYPLTISLFYRIFEDRRAVICFQILLEGFTIFLISLFPNAPYLSSLFYTLNLHQALYATQIMTDILFTFLLSVALLSFFIFIKRNSILHLYLSSFFSGLGSLTRPIGLLLPVIFLPFVFKRNKKHTFFYIFLYLSVLSPHIIRNKIVHGQVFFSTIGFLNMLDWCAAPTMARVDNISENEARRKLKEMVKNRYGLNKEDIEFAGDIPAVARKFGIFGLKYILSHPFPFTVEVVKGALRVFSPTELMIWSIYFGNGDASLMERKGSLLKNLFKGEFKKTAEDVRMFLKSPFAVLFFYLLLFFAIYYILSIKGLRVLFKQEKETAVFIILVILYLSILPVGAGSPRFRLPFEPLLSYLAGIGVKGLKK